MSSPPALRPVSARWAGDVVTIKVEGVGALRIRCEAEPNAIEIDRLQMA